MGDAVTSLIIQKLKYSEQIVCHFTEDIGSELDEFYAVRIVDFAYAADDAGPTPRAAVASKVEVEASNSEVNADHTQRLPADIILDIILEPSV